MINIDDLDLLEKLEQAGIDAGLKPLTIYTRQNIEVYKALLEYRNRHLDTDLTISEMILSDFASNHMQLIDNRLLMRVVIKSEFKKNIKKGDIFTFDNLSWWTSDNAFINFYCESVLEDNSYHKPWFYIFFMEKGRAADLNAFSSIDEYIIPQKMTFKVLEKEDIPVLRKTFIPLKIMA